MNQLAIGLILGACGLITLIAVFTATYFYKKWKKASRIIREHEVKINGSTAEDLIDPSLSKYQISRDDIEIESARIVGVGNFGKVVALVVRGRAAAVKIPKADRYTKYLSRELNTVKVMGYLGAHPHLVEFIGFNIEQLDRGKMYTVTGLCENGTLLGYLRRRNTEENGASTNPPISTYELLKFSYEIASGMKYMWYNKVVHGDLAARNVFLDKYFICKIGHFSSSRRLHEEDEYVLQESVSLHWRWMPPECLSRMAFSPKSDVWSYGVTIWEIFSLGRIPYADMAWTNSFVGNLETGCRLQSPQQATPEIYSEMCRCWQLDPALRPSFSELAEFFRLLRSTDYSRVL